MEILYLTDQTYLHGGIEKVLSQKANYFADVLDYEVTIVTYNQRGNNNCYMFSSKIRFIDLGINYETGKSYFHPHHLKKIPYHRSALKKIIQQLKPDIIISSSFGPDFYFLPFIEKHIPKIKEFHASRYFYNQVMVSAKTKVLHWLDQRTENKYEQLVVLNDSEKNFYNNENVCVIPNPAEVSGDRADVSVKKIMAAGRISPVKNFADLIDAFSRLSAEFPHWEVHFFGEDYGGTQKKLEDKITKYGLQDQIKFKGISQDLKKEMQNYSIYGMTSITECFPMVLLESLSVGLPVISYDSPTGPQHILTHDVDSFLVPYKNLDIFTEKLKHLMKNENLRKEMGAQGIENVQRFSIEVVMKQWKDLFNTLV